MRRDYSFITLILGTITIPPIIGWLGIHLSLTTVQISAEQWPVLLYCEGFGELPPIFNEREALHLLDVRRILVGFSLIAFINALALLCIMLMSRASPGKLSGLFLGGGLCSLGILALGGIAILLDFRSAFRSIHYILFEPGTWTFPMGSTITNLFPVSFFQSVTQGALSAWVLLTFLFISAGLFSRKGSGINDSK